MTTARCDLTVLTSRVISALNAGTAATYGTTINDDRRSAGEITAAILSADARVCHAICESTENGYRTLFMSEVDLTHGEEISEPIGPIGRPKIQPYEGAEWVLGHPKSADEIDSYRANTESLYDEIDHDEEGSSLAGFFDYDPIAKAFRFTGHAAKVSIATFTKSEACQSPVAYEDTVFGLALSVLPKEGDSAPYIGLIGAQAVNHLREIKSGAMEVSPIDVPELAQVGAR
jgi:hypothetical protein